MPTNSSSTPSATPAPIQALTDWLDASSLRSFPAMLLDMYPRGRVDQAPYRPGQDPMEITGWFDGGNYTISKNPEYGNLWIQGGPRARVFFADDPWRAPALNKIPLVKWDARYTWVSSTHSLLPRGLNRVYDEWGGEKMSGCLLHAKFLDLFIDKSREEIGRRQHFAATATNTAPTSTASRAIPTSGAAGRNATRDGGSSNGWGSCRRGTGHDGGLRHARPRPARPGGRGRAAPRPRARRS
jgi:hypothetical protein